MRLLEHSEFENKASAVSGKDPYRSEQVVNNLYLTKNNKYIM